MSGGGGGVIIINSLIENPGTTADEKEELRNIAGRHRIRGRCDRRDAWRVCRIVWRLVRER